LLSPYLNGKEWLARQMEQAGMRYRRHDNCFTWIEDFSRSQKLMAKQLRANWVPLFDAVAQQAHPLLAEMCQQYPMQYYWACTDSEWATDIVFRESGKLRRLYPQLVHLGMTSFSSPDVLRFMGKRVSQYGGGVASDATRCGRPISSGRGFSTSAGPLLLRLGGGGRQYHSRAAHRRGSLILRNLSLRRRNGAAVVPGAGILPITSDADH
jgi:hypothetical protein